MIATAGVNDLLVTGTVNADLNGFKTTGGNSNILHECCSELLLTELLLN